jgi:hypothetical protein
MQLKVEIPTKLKFLFEPHRYKVARGGRGSGKSWSFARALIVRALSQKTRILCAREIQKSIKESVHRLLTDQIEIMGVGDCFTINDTSLTCSNGSEFFFEGLFRNVNRIKSIEGVDIAWVEEAETVSDESWVKLIPTIRTPRSEIWVTFNPRYEDDPTYVRFVTQKPDNAVSVIVNYADNPYFPDELLLEMTAEKARDVTRYRNIWLGEPVGAGAKIWHKYDEVVHVRNFDFKPLVGRTNLFMGCDPHSKFWPACVWVALVPKNDTGKDFWRVVYDEYPTIDDVGGYYSDIRSKLYYTGTLEDLARGIYSHDGIGVAGAAVRKRFIDTRFAKGVGGGNWGTSTLGIVQEWAKPNNGGLLFDMPPERIIDVQRDAILMDMDYNKLMPLGPFNDPNLVVLPHCKNVRQTLANHRCVEGKEQEDDKYKDFSDALRITWAGMADCPYKDLSAKKEKEYAYSTESWMS